MCSTMFWYPVCKDNYLSIFNITRDDDHEYRERAAKRQKVSHHRQKQDPDEDEDEDVDIECDDESQPQDKTYAVFHIEVYLLYSFCSVFWVWSSVY